MNDDLISRQNLLDRFYHWANGLYFSWSEKNMLKKVITEVENAPCMYATAKQEKPDEGEE